MMPLRMMLAAAGAGGGEIVPVDWSNYNTTNDKTPVEFSASAVTYVKTVQIDSTRFLIVYSGASAFCRARIGTLTDGGIVSFGTEAVILSAVVLDVAVDLLDSTHAIIAVESGGAVKTIAIEFSTSTIDTVGSAVSTETLSSSYLEIAAISSTEFFVCYAKTSTTTNRVYYASVSGTTITMGSGINFVSATILDLDICNLTSTTAIISYGRSGLFDWSAVLITKSGTAPVVTDTHFIWSASITARSRSIRRLSDTAAIATISEDSGSDIVAVVITESGGVLANGTRQVVDTVKGEYISIALPDTEHAVITYQVAETTMKTTVVEISGSTLTPLTAYTNDSADREYVHSSEVGTNFVAVGYRDEDDSNKGKVKVLTV